MNKTYIGQSGITSFAQIGDLLFSNSSSKPCKLVQNRQKQRFKKYNKNAKIPPNYCHVSLCIATNLFIEVSDKGGVSLRTFADITATADKDLLFYRYKGRHKVDELTFVEPLIKKLGSVPYSPNFSLSQDSDENRGYFCSEFIIVTLKANKLLPDNINGKNSPLELLSYFLKSKDLWKKLSTNDINTQDIFSTHHFYYQLAYQFKSKELASTKHDFEPTEVNNIQLPKSLEDFQNASLIYGKLITIYQSKLLPLWQKFKKTFSNPPLELESLLKKNILEKQEILESITYKVQEGKKITKDIKGLEGEERINAWSQHVTKILNNLCFNKLNFVNTTGNLFDNRLLAYNLYYALDYKKDLLLDTANELEIPEELQNEFRKKAHETSEGYAEFINKIDKKTLKYFEEELQEHQLLIYHKTYCCDTKRVMEIIEHITQQIFILKLHFKTQGIFFTLKIDFDKHINRLEEELRNNRQKYLNCLYKKLIKTGH